MMGSHEICNLINYNCVCINVLEVIQRKASAYAVLHTLRCLASFRNYYR